MLTGGIRRFSKLLISEHCDRVLKPQPFSPNVARRTIELLRILDQISAETNSHGAMTARGEELKQTFFVGDKAWFSDEGAENKRDFSFQMTFPNPGDGANALQCFWHGKIKTPQYRIHFEWPNPEPNKPIKIVYIGPKISKR